MGEEAAAAVESLADRLRNLSMVIMAAVPPIKPGACHWLNSDAAFSYCWPCAREARWRQLPTIGPAPAETHGWHRDPQEDLIYDGIDGYLGGGESDSPELCACCSCTLDYRLTDYGVREEVSAFLEGPTADGHVTGEVTYALDRIFMSLAWDGADANLQREAITIAEATISALPQADPA